MEDNINTGAAKAPVIIEAADATKEGAAPKAITVKKPSTAKKATVAKKATDLKKVETEEKPNEFSEKVAVFFEDKPKAKELFVTEDGFMFTDRYFACKHAETLEVKEPIHFKNPATIEVVEEEEETE